MNMKLTLLLISFIFSLFGCTSEYKKNQDERIEKDLNQASITNVQLGAGYIRRGQFEVAEKKLLKAIEQDEDNTPLLLPFFLTASSKKQ